MELFVTDTAKEKLQKYIDDPKAQLILDFDDGVGPLSLEGSCTLNNNFRVVVVDPKDDSYKKDYEKSMPSNIGPFLYKGYSEMYMDKKLKLDVNPATTMIKLVGANSGELTGAVPVVDLRD
ncbi:hypothetical protein FC40_GL001174 [Ligilactobacillus hayakitensis DSM 18933 = JCM 14209]|uniref:Core domain-containing protein n=1 Tax=Ligilactobacillus hayakitensis DSM 18933 = JCM 14209 TaxID=1423755 RepID=A0A0R1WH97_9LACO|nr:iron-sulfur cluster biosynthesis family protein [Ligilactobacillus hayakitensis]KRM17402.1 hypothetical protein FC40_GL001174 [Ligilactobacillus hayakitensis DSM 18933 = JCM 14209]